MKLRHGGSRGRRWMGLLLWAIAAPWSAATATGPEFTVCFRPPAPRPPELPVVRAVLYHGDRLATGGARGLELARLRALITHESGGDPRALSPTGCLGLLALCTPDFARPRCCRPGPDDGYEYLYDTCNAERIRGPECLPAGERRYDPVFSLRYGRNLLAQGLRGLPPASDPDVYVPIFWNAGAQVLPRSAKGLTSPREAIEQLDFLRDEAYGRFSDHDLLNKLIEIWDYEHWYPELVRFWSGRAPGAAREVAGLDCVAYRGARGNRAYSLSEEELAAATPPFVAVRIKRLSSGRYAEDHAWYHPSFLAGLGASPGPSSAGSPPRPPAGAPKARRAGEPTAGRPAGKARTSA